jgi:hypothetical protein
MFGIMPSTKREGQIMLNMCMEQCEGVYLMDEIKRLRGVLLTVLEACEDVNSPDRKVREEITRTVRKELKEKE